MSKPPAAELRPGELDPVEADLCIVGAGPGGLALATAAAAYGQTVVLIEKHRLGGTSLNYGSLPSKALVASAERAHAFRTAAAFGIGAFEPAIDRAQIEAHSRQIVEAVATNASVERLAGLGVRVIQAAARFADQRSVVAGPHKITARRFVIATGSTPVIPDIKGLDGVPYLTTDTVFQSRTAFDHLIIVGGGAAAVELAQAHRRLGARVSLVARGAVLARIDPELAAVVRERLAAEGVVILERAGVDTVDGGGGRVRIEATAGGQRTRLEGSHLLIACGRRPAVADIGLEAARVKTGADGIKVNAILRTSNRRIYALGDVTGLPYSTQRAEYHADLLVRTVLFRAAARVEPHGVPATIHTDPGFASVGLSEADARARHSTIQVLRWPLRENAQAAVLRTPAGHIKVIADKGGRILGAAIVARAAQELIQVWALAISKQLTLDDMTRWVAPYPSLGDVSRKAAASRSIAAIGHVVSRRWVKLLAKLG